MSPEKVYVHVCAHFLRTGWGLFKMGRLKKRNTQKNPKWVDCFASNIKAYMCYNKLKIFYGK